MKFASLWSFRVSLCVLTILGLVLGLVLSIVRYVEHVKVDAYSSATVSLGPRLHTNALDDIVADQ